MANHFLKFQSKYNSQEKIIESIYLKALIDSYDRIKLIKDINTYIENKIRNEIIKDFENKNDIIKYWIDLKIISLSSEKQIIKENDIKRTDIEFFISEYGTFVIECKRLKSTEQRYIKGRFDEKEKKYKEDGIERFTNSIYAKEDEFAGMIGFIVGGDMNTIVKNLKDRVKNFKYSNDNYDLLDLKCAGWETSFQSKHFKNNDKIKTIHLYHLFFNFCKDYN